MEPGSRRWKLPTSLRSRTLTSGGLWEISTEGAPLGPARRRLIHIARSAKPDLLSAVQRGSVVTTSTGPACVSQVAENTTSGSTTYTRRPSAISLRAISANIR